MTKIVVVKTDSVRDILLKAFYSFSNSQKKKYAWLPLHKVEVDFIHIIVL